MGCLHAIGAGPGEDEHGHGVVAVEIAVDRIILRTEFDPGHIGQPSEPAIGAALDDDVGEFVGGLQAALARDRELGVGGVWQRCLADLAGGHLHVLLPQRRHDVTGGEVERGEPLDVEPDPHRVFGAAEDPQFTDAVDAGEDVANLQIREIGDVELVARSVGGDEVHDEQQFGRRLCRDDSRLPHLRRQAGLGAGDAVLHEHLRPVDVGAKFKRHGERHAAVVGRLRLDIEHVFDAVDLLLERRGDRFGDGLGRGPRVAGRDHDGGEGDLGILRHR